MMHKLSFGIYCTAGMHNPRRPQSVLYPALGAGLTRKAHKNRVFIINPLSAKLIFVRIEKFCVCVLVCVCICVYVCLFVCLYVCMYVCLYVPLALPEDCLLCVPLASPDDCLLTAPLYIANL